MRERMPMAEVKGGSNARILNRSISHRESLLPKRKNELTVLYQDRENGAPASTMEPRTRSFALLKNGDELERKVANREDRPRKCGNQAHIPFVSGFESPIGKRKVCLFIQRWEVGDAKRSPFIFPTIACNL